MDDPLHPVQIEGFRRMTPAQKLRMVCDLYEAGIQLRVAGLRMKHPDYDTLRGMLDDAGRTIRVHAA